MKLGKTISSAHVSGLFFKLIIINNKIQHKSVLSIVFMIASL